MKMKLKMKRFFNLIEVSLAMGVTAVGILGAVTILPIALKTTSSTTYSAYLSDASNMIFAGIDNFLNEECYLYGYEAEHKSDVTTEKLQEIYTARQNKFSRIFPDNISGSINLNAGLEIPSDSTSNSGVHVVLVKQTKGNGTGEQTPDSNKHSLQYNHGLIAFYPKSTSASDIKVPPEYYQCYGSSQCEKLRKDKACPATTNKIGRPLFVARYRIIVTGLENDSEFKMDGLRVLVSATTDQSIGSTGEWNDQDSTIVEGLRVAATKRFLNLDELDREERNRRNEKDKRMKRVYVEFSWPYNAHYESRNKKTFVKEYYLVD